jgi:hypothetical protein
MVFMAQQYPVPKNFTTIRGTTGQLLVIKINSIQTQVEGINVNITSFLTLSKCDNTVWTKRVTEAKTGRKRTLVTRNG